MELQEVPYNCMFEEFLRRVTKDYYENRISLEAALLKNMTAINLEITKRVQQHKVSKS